MPDRYRDAYPYPTRGEAPYVRQAFERHLEEEFWNLPPIDPYLENPPAKPLECKHTHQLCGHDCLSGACNGMEAICISCEFQLQDSRGRQSPFKGKLDGQG